MALNRLYAIVGITGVIVLFGVYYSFNPQHYNFFPECPFYKITGYNCPGCGSQRAVHSLLHGELLKAVHFNLLLVISVPFLITHFTYKVISIIKNKDIKWPVVYYPATPKVVFILVIAFWILRNLPVYPLSLFKA